MRQVRQELIDLDFIQERLNEIRCKHTLTSDREMYDDILEITYEIAKMQGRLEAKIEIKENKK